MSNIFSMTDTWNNGATVFSAIKMTVTDTASDPASTFIDASGVGATRFRVFKGIDNFAVMSAKTQAAIGILSALSDNSWYGVHGGNIMWGFNYTNNLFQLSTGKQLGWGPGDANSTVDVGITRTAAGIIKITNGSTGSGVIQTGTFTVAALPAAATAGAGARSFVTDSTVVAAANFGAIVAGTGANGVPVFSDGTNWRIG